MPLDRSAESAPDIPPPEINKPVKSGFCDNIFSVISSATTNQLMVTANGIFTLKVTNTVNNLSVYVKVTDRMGNKSRNHIDLSKCAFDSIGNPKSGRIKVIVEEVVISNL